MARHLRWVVAGLGCCLFGGCYQKVADQDGLTFSFQPWVPLLVAAVGLAAVPVGCVMYAKQKRFAGGCLAVAGPLVAVAVAPGMYMDRVTVSQDRFYSRHGFWWSPTVHDIRYADLQLVRVGFEENTGRRGRKSYSYHFDCTFKSGRQERVPLGDIMREALPEVAGQFRAHGVPVEIPPNLPE